MKILLTHNVGSVQAALKYITFPCISVSKAAIHVSILLVSINSNDKICMFLTGNKQLSKLQRHHQIPCSLATHTFVTFQMFYFCIESIHTKYTKLCTQQKISCLSGQFASVLAYMYMYMHTLLSNLDYQNSQLSNRFQVYVIQHHTTV